MHRSAELLSMSLGYIALPVAAGVAAAALCFLLALPWAGLSGRAAVVGPWTTTVRGCGMEKE